MLKHSTPEWKEKVILQSRSERYTRRLLLFLYKVSCALSLISCRLNRNPLLFTPNRRRRNKWLLLIWRFVVVIIYWGVLPALFFEFQKSPKNYADLFAQLQSLSVVLFAVGSFIVQSRSERKILSLLNRYLAIYRRISAFTQSSRMLPTQFLVLCTLKFFITLWGCVHEMVELFMVNHVVIEGRLLAAMFGMYMWLGMLFVLDMCFMALLITSFMYKEMGTHIQEMLEHMRPIEEEKDLLGQRMTDYRRMQLLCDYSDELDECAIIYRELYDLTLCFCSACQWQIFFCVYYNFEVALLLLYQCFCLYLEKSEMGLVLLIMAGNKMANLVLLLMCADAAVKNSHLPERLPLDIVCTDIDQRWDASAESFLSQLKVQHLEIKILGFFKLDNKFILIILSAIISYLFIMVQFGLTGGFEESELVKQLLNVQSEGNSDVSNKNNSNISNNNK
ncbi:gustatory receptor for bitter taste 93a [Scaptodrosophila lebanonensis]|uniref:Gustatory receptor n=1 Tax=Drosophila lebanonensis TaxID=7225 RepID=A0A6J2T0M1_DROLE|nr:gustatory receptor for bitter taste 93a [Scaptodrosophila lebanonensis]